MNQLSEIEAFIAAVEAGSLSAAAQRLGIAISAVSRRVTLLERRLGVQLAIRSPQGLALTANGCTYYESCRRIVADLIQAENDARGDDGATQGIFRIAGPLEFGTRYLAPLLNRFSAPRPDLTIDLDLSDRQVDLVAEGFDFGIRIGAVHDDRLIARELFRVSNYVAASPEFWQRVGRPTEPGDLSGLPALAYRSGATPSIWRYTDPSGTTGTVSMQARYISTSCDFLQIAAEEGLGVVLEPEFICRTAIETGALEAVLTDHCWGEMPVSIIYARGRPLPARTRLLIDHLDAELIAAFRTDEH